MKAMTYHKYGTHEQLLFQELEIPTPKKNEVQVRNHATSINAADWRLLTGTPTIMRLGFGLFKPNNPILGADVAGIVTALGENVTQFKVGDCVYGDASSSGMGAFAEFVCVQEQHLALAPQQISLAQAAAVPLAAMTALQGLRMGGIKAGQQILIHGASGGVGTFALQIAKALGAHVTAVCSSQKVAQAYALGADTVIDYQKTDVWRAKERFDLILDIAAQRHFLEYKPLLQPHGQYVIVGGAFKHILSVLTQGMLYSKKNGQTFASLLALPKQSDLLYLSSLLEAGLIKPIIEQTFSLLELPHAMQYFSAGHARGKLSISMEAL
jgi:NADPH:quinone reductase-like Zn-dependent oxidoreductase